MTQEYKNILVAVDGSEQAAKAFAKAVCVARNNQARLVVAYVIDQISQFRSTAFDQSFYDNLESEAKTLLAGYISQAQAEGVAEVASVLESGNPKQLLASDIPARENIDLIVVGATGLSAFERLLLG